MDVVVSKRRKYSTLEEAREAKLLKDREYYRKKKPDAETGVIGRKCEKSLEDIIKKERERNIRYLERKKLKEKYKELSKDEIEEKLKEIMKDKKVDVVGDMKVLKTIEERRAKSNERVKRWLERKKSDVGVVN